MPDISQNNILICSTVHAFKVDEHLWLDRQYWISKLLFELNIEFLHCHFSSMLKRYVNIALIGLILYQPLDEDQSLQKRRLWSTVKWLEKCRHTCFRNGSHANSSIVGFWVALTIVMPNLLVTKVFAVIIWYCKQFFLLISRMGFFL